MDLPGVFRRAEVIAGVALVLYVLWNIVQRIIFAYDKHLSKIPGPWLSALTNVPLKLAVMSGKRTVYIHKLHQKYGPIVRVTPNEVAVADRDSVQKIHRVGTDFRKGEWYQQQAPNQYSDETCGVFGIRGLKNAQARRRYFLQAGTKRNVVEWEPQIKNIVHRAVAKIKRDAKNGKANLVKWWSLMTADVLGDLAFGEAFGMVEGEQKTQMIIDIEEAMVVIGLRMELPWIWNFLTILPLPSAKKLTNMTERFNAYGEVAVKNTKLAANGLTKTMFSKMVPEDGSAPIADSVVQMEAVNIIIAGTDTTAMTLVYLVYAVLSDESIRQKLLAELKTCSAHPNWQELEDLTYTNMVISETLRLYSAVPASLPRTCPQGGAMLGGYFIPEKITVSTQAYTLHRDPKIWSEPERFNPDRWLNPTPEMKEHFMAFGGTARTCIGQNVARLELLHAVHTFFTELPNAKLLPTTNDKSMAIVDFFVIKPKSGVCEITAG